MISNLSSQLKEQGALDRMAEVHGGGAAGAQGARAIRRW